MANGFCVVPWHDLYSTSIGTFRLCCLESDDLHNNQTAIDQGIEQHWNAEYMQQARLDFLAGKKHHACAQCWADDTDGKVSLRQRRNFKYLGRYEVNDDDVAHFRSITDGQGSTSTNSIAGTNLSVNNICQLRCNHCGPSYSHNISKDYVKLGWDDDYKSRKTIFLNKYLGPTQQKEFNVDFWPELKKVSDQFQLIHCTGGEPSINRGLIEYFEWLDQQGLAKNIDLGFNTNAVKISDRWLSAIKKFQSVTVRISVDSVGDLEHYIRFPSRWSSKAKNIYKYAITFGTVILNPTLYALNIANFPGFLTTTASWPTQCDPALLYYPNSLDIKNMPDAFKSTMIDRLKLTLTTIAEEGCRNGIQAAINRLKQPRDEQLWQEAKSIIKSYDQIRPFTLASVSPDLAPYLD